jgi:hypothetical protein
MTQHVAWPNGTSWRALADGARFTAGDGTLYVSEVVDCGDLLLPTGQLTACDPYADLWSGPTRAIPVAPGRYPVRLTLFDVSGAADGSHHRVAYASVLLADRPETTRRVLTPGRSPDEADPDLGPGEFYGFPVDAGTACFVDGGALAYGMPSDGDWYEPIFDNGTPSSWFARMDDPGHIGEGIANIPLPLADDEANIVLFHSGWGDGHYPTIGGFDTEGALVAVHLDFFVAPEPNDGE